jgi:hypothetical protein
MKPTTLLASLLATAEIVSASGMVARKDKDECKSPHGKARGYDEGDCKDLYDTDNYILLTSVDIDCKSKPRSCSLFYLASAFHADTWHSRFLQWSDTVKRAARGAGCSPSQNAITVTDFGRPVLDP